MSKMKEFIKTAWKRVTSSKAAWLSLPMACAQAWMSISGVNISKQVEIIFSAVWAVLAVFLATNNPTDSGNF
jgi:hypothetical protein